MKTFDSSLCCSKSCSKAFRGHVIKFNWMKCIGAIVTWSPPGTQSHHTLWAESGIWGSGVLSSVNYYKCNFEQGTEMASPEPWVAVNYCRFVPSLGFRNLWSSYRPKGAEHNIYLCRHRHILASAWLEESPCHWISFKWLSVRQNSTCLHWLLYPPPICIYSPLHYKPVCHQWLKFPRGCAWIHTYYIFLLFCF